MTMHQVPLTFEHKVHFRQARHGRKELVSGEIPGVTEKPRGRIPRVARLMALAIRLEKLVSQGKVRDYAELARLGYVTRSRITQIMNLLYLAPDIQEELLFLPPIESGRDPIKEWQMRPIAAELEWRKQRELWAALVSE